MAVNKTRLVFIDYLRGFIVLLVVLDHSVQGYAERFGKFWFMPDARRSPWFDALHMFDNGYMMMVLFFLAGLFVLPSLKRHGYLSFARARFLRLGVPFVVGVPILCPLLTYPEFEVEQHHFVSFGEYTRELFTSPAMRGHWEAGPLWFVFYLALLTVLLVALYALAPGLMVRWSDLILRLRQRPWLGFAVALGASAVILGGSDFIWGAHRWIVFHRLFAVQASRFILQAFYFFVGAGLAEAGLLARADTWDGLARRWPAWLLATVVVAAVYIGYSLNFYDRGAYNTDLRHYFLNGGAVANCWPVFAQAAPMVLVRTTLHAGFCTLITLSLLAMFRALLNTPRPLWASLAACSFGIYLTHEPFVVFAHFYLNGSAMPMVLKWLLTTSSSLVLSWLLVHASLKAAAALQTKARAAAPALEKVPLDATATH